MNTLFCRSHLFTLIRLSRYKQCSMPLLINATNYKTPIFTNDSRKLTTESIGKSQYGIFQAISDSAPVEYLQNFLIYVHDQYSLPWWATIITTTVLLRTCITVPFAIYQQSILAKVENISTEMPAIAKELQKETAIAIKMFNWDERTAKHQYKISLKKQWKKLIIRDNCHPFKASILLWFQIPLWVSYSMSLRNLVYLLPKGDLDAHIIYTELTLGGFGWIPNLIEADVSYILPVALGLINLLNVEINALLKTKPSSKLQKYITNFFRGISVIMVPLAASVPSCLALYWTISSSYGIVQTLILMSPKVKRFCRIPQTSSELENPYNHVLSAFKNKYLSNLK